MLLLGILSTIRRHCHKWNLFGQVFLLYNIVSSFLFNTFKHYYYHHHQTSNTSIYKAIILDIAIKLVIKYILAIYDHSNKNSRTPIRDEMTENTKNNDHVRDDDSTITINVIKHSSIIIWSIGILSMGMFNYGLAMILITLELPLLLSFMIFSSGHGHITTNKKKNKGWIRRVWGWSYSPIIMLFLLECIGRERSGLPPPTGWIMYIVYGMIYPSTAILQSIIS